MKKIFYPLLILLSVSGGFVAGAKERTPVKFAYDVDFQMYFDNREYQAAFSPSMTIFGARLTPTLGIEIDHGMRHRVMAGIDVMKDFGASPVSEIIAGGATPETSPELNNLSLFRELLLYYRLDCTKGKTGISLVAGVFPRRFSEGLWPTSFFSEKMMYYDTNLEGLLVSFRRPSAYYEIGCDWMGMYGTDRRERFMIFSCGEGFVAPFLSLGYNAYLYHFANSRNVRGLVDNALVYPFISSDIGYLAGMQRLGVTVGWLQSVQRNRKHVGKYVFPAGGELVMDIRNWNVGLQYRLFCGRDLMPYYNAADEGGFQYGDRLYFGDPFYRVYDSPSDAGRIGCYHRVEAYYEPAIADFVSLKIALTAHFNKGYSGFQQMVGLKFSLERLLDKYQK